MNIRPKGVVMIDRRSGKPVGPAISLKSSDNFYRLPRLDQRVWRYMDYWKLENLVKEKTLYFRRSDRLEDDMEGRYAEANRTYTTAVWQRFTQTYAIQHDPAAQEEGALGFRYRIFLSCWHINDIENPGMWRLYTKTADSVVVVSTVRKLLAQFEKHHVQAGRVNYAPRAVPRPEWSHLAPFFFKDTAFMMEREFRLVSWPPDDQPVAIETMTGLSLPIHPETLIDLVKLHPNSSLAFKEQVRTLLTSQNTKLPVSKSSLTLSP